MAKDRDQLHDELERDLGVKLPPVRCDPGWEVPRRQILVEMRLRGLLGKVAARSTARGDDGVTLRYGARGHQVPVRARGSRP